MQWNSKEEPMVKVSADRFTGEQLGITEEVISDTKARQVCEQLSDNKNYKIALSNDQLVIQRFLRD
jgi:hypothetical protein